MRYRALRERVWLANTGLVGAGLAILTWGNASGLDRKAGVMAIKPSGVDYEDLEPDDLVIVSVESGEVVEGSLRPSSDSPTHLALYRAFAGVGGVVHAHSTHATAWAQAGRAIPCLGTTHADHFNGPVPVTRQLTDEEIASAYEENTGRVIVECFSGGGLNPQDVPAALVPGHGPFAWGPDPDSALQNAVALEAVARMALLTLRVDADAPVLPEALLRKHFLRKHGPDAYYGQRE